MFRRLVCLLFVGMMMISFACAIDRQVQDVDDGKKVTIVVNVDSNTFVIDEAFSDNCVVSDDGVSEEIDAFRSNWDEGVWVLIDDEPLDLEMYYVVNDDCEIDESESVAGVDLERGVSDSGSSGSTGLTGDSSSEDEVDNSVGSEEDLEDFGGNSSSEDEKGTPWFWIILIALVIIVVIGLVLYFIFRKKEEEEEVLEEEQTI